MDILAERVIELMDEQGLTCRYLAYKLNVSDSVISNYRGKGSKPPNPTANRLVQLCDIFDVSADYLLGRTDVKKPQKSQLP